MQRMHSGATVVALALFLVPTAGRAGCLAPADAAVDAGIGSGPLWANDAGSLVYARVGVSGRTSLTLRGSDGTVGDVAVVGNLTGFSVGASPTTWDGFVSGTVNATGDLAFVASTTAPDDPNTSVDESGSHRGAYARNTATIFEMARFGDPSPVSDGAGGFVPWGSAFEAAVADRDASGFVSVVFSAQLDGPTDQRFGLFRWSEGAPGTVTPAVMLGDAAPGGGTFVSITRLRGNGPGLAAFFGVTQTSPSGPQAPAIFLLHADGSVTRAVNFGTSGGAAPGGGKFSVSKDFDLDDAGGLVFAATLQGAAKKSGLFRAAAPSYASVALVGEGDATPVAGTFGDFGAAAVRADGAGDAVFSVPMSDDVGGVGVFTVAAAATTAAPLVLADQVVSVAAIGSGDGAYMTPTQIHVVVPSNGTDEGPTDLRIVNLDVKNNVPLAKDSITFQGSFLLPPWDAAPPAVFRGDAVRTTPTATLTGAALTKIVEAKLFVSSGPGNNFTFGIAGTDAAPIGSCSFNGSAQTVKKLVVKPDGSAATWTFTGNPGPGSLAVDLAAGTFKLTVSAATIQPSYDATNFRAAFLLRSAADVAQSRPDAQSFFGHDLRIAGAQPDFGAGRRVTSKGEGTPGGTVFVDSLKVTRKPASKTKPATDAMQLAGTLRLCPGTISFPTPTLSADVVVGSFHLDSVTMTRVGKKGAAYRYSAAGAVLTLDLVKATFTLKATTPALPELVDPVAGSATNGSTGPVGGMKLAFSLDVPRVYSASFDVAMTRLKGGKVFQR